MVWRSIFQTPQIPVTFDPFRTKKKLIQSTAVVIKLKPKQQEKEGKKNSTKYHLK